MDTLDSRPEGAVTAGSLTTVYARAATDSDDVMECRPGSDVGHWHSGHITQWSDEENDMGMSARGDITIPASVAPGLLEAGTEQTDNSEAGTEQTANSGMLAKTRDVTKSKGGSTTFFESQPTATADQAADRPAVEPLDTIHTDVGTLDARTKP